MNVSTFIAKRYLFSKKSRNIINVISLISFFGILLSAASLIIILSAFNGIQYYVEDMYGRHAADLYIDPINGKKITADHDVFSFLSINEKIETFHKQIEETALLKFNKQWETAKIIGTDSVLFHTQNWEGDMTQGIAALYFKKIPSILLGYGLQYKLQVETNHNFMTEISLYAISNNKKLSIQNKSLLKKHNLILNGVFSINPDIDESTAIIDYRTANAFFNYNNGASSILVYTKNNNEVNKLKDEINAKFPTVKASTHEEKNKLIYAANDAEKWMVMAVLILVLLLSSFTITSAITMLIIDKKKDIFTLTSLGCQKNTIRAIFFKEGLFISLLGSFSGLILGVIICLLQMKFEFIKLNDAALDYWPIHIKISDLLLLLIILSSVGFLSSYIPGRLLMKRIVN